MPWNDIFPMPSQHEGLALTNQRVWRALSSILLSTWGIECFYSSLAVAILRTSLTERVMRDGGQMIRWCADTSFVVLQLEFLLISEKTCWPIAFDNLIIIWYWCRTTSHSDGEHRLCSVTLLILCPVVWRHFEHFLYHPGGHRVRYALAPKNGRRLAFLMRRVAWMSFLSVLWEFVYIL